MKDAFNINLDQGQTYTLPIRLANVDSSPIDISGWSWKAQIKTSVESEKIEGTFTVTVLSPTQGSLAISLSSSDTYALNRQNYYYDLMGTDTSGKTLKYLEGRMFVDPTITHVP